MDQISKEANVVMLDENFKKMYSSLKFGSRVEISPDGKTWIFVAKIRWKKPSAFELARMMVTVSTKKLSPDRLGP